jgi:L-iditol 2-dehydrogenase
MKALILTGYNRLSFENVPEPSIGPDDVLVRVKACGICGSDVHGMDGSSGRRRPPIIMGHEAAGVIEKIGAKVTGWKFGQRVTFDSTVYCGTCAFCKTGKINLCNNRRVLGVSCEDYRQHGAFAEFVVVPQRILYRLPDELPFEHAAFVEPLSIAVHAAHRAHMAAHETVVVVGAGMIGLLQIQVLRAYGCSRIIAVDVAPEKLEMARKLGATETINSASSSVVENILQRTDGRGVDLSFECVGIGATIDIAVRAVRKGGRITLIGNISPSVALPLQAVVTRELTINGSCASCGEYPECLELMAAGAVNVAPLTSAVVPLADGAKWFERLYQKEAGLLKVILTP